MPYTDTHKPTAYLLYGFAGAGKTTYAKKLEKEAHAFRFTHDEWMMRLYPEIKDGKEFALFYERSKSLMWEVLLHAVELRNNVILDWGFWSRLSRDEARERLLMAGAEVELHYLFCSDKVMKQRVMERNRSFPVTHAFYMSEATLNEFRQRLEPLGNDEQYTIINS
jgi:predicted kinase